MQDLLDPPSEIDAETIQRDEAAHERREQYRMAIVSHVETGQPLSADAEALGKALGFERPDTTRHVAVAAKRRADSGTLDYWAKQFAEAREVCDAINAKFWAEAPQAIEAAPYLSRRDVAVELTTQRELDLLPPAGVMTDAQNVIHGCRQNLRETADLSIDDMIIALSRRQCYLQHESAKLAGVRDRGGVALGMSVGPERATVEVLNEEIGELDRRIGSPAIVSTTRKELRRQQLEMRARRDAVTHACHRIYALGDEETAIIDEIQRLEDSKLDWRNFLLD